MEVIVAHLFFTSLARSVVSLALALTAGGAGAQSLLYGNSPGGYPGNVSYAGGAASLQTGTTIELVDWRFGGNVAFTFQTGATADGWSFAPGGTVSMAVGAGFGGGIDLNNDFTPDLLPGTTLFTGVLGATTVSDRRGPSDEYGYRFEPCEPMCIGSSFDIRASFSTSDLNAAYAAALGLPTGSYTGTFLFGINDWNGAATNQQVFWREVRLDLNSQMAVTPIPEPETYAMMLAGLSLLGIAARRRRKPVTG